MKVIVTTTIHAPTEAIQLFDRLTGWTLVVVGDLKTPEYKLERGYYMTPQDQYKYDPELSDAIGWNCIQRRNFGFLWAREMGAEIVATVDDDNVPLPGWGQNLLLGVETLVKCHQTDAPAFDPIGATGSKLWHRGFPLPLLATRSSRVIEENVRPDIQADFWQGDPDVDAICRMEHAPFLDFDDEPFPMASNKMGPFNSQNTFLLAKVLPDYFMFPYVGRMDDIWPSYYAQAMGHRPVWNKPSVTQYRNEQDVLVNMANEFLGYRHNLEIVQRLAKAPQEIWTFCPNPKTKLAYDLYRRHFP